VSSNSDKIKAAIDTVTKGVASIDSSKKTIGLYPTEKIGYESIVSICPANRLNTLITDWDASEEDLQKYDEQGIEVIVVDKDE